MLPKTLRTERYLEQTRRWPESGRHILAHYDDETVVVYQAYSPGIGRYAAKHQRFGGSFSYERMSWIKPNFLWMMYRSGWGQKPGQEVTLAITLQREAFDRILAGAVASSFRGAEEDRAAWKAKVKRSEVRLQWDPDHSPSGGKLERRAIQLGLRGEALRLYGHEWIVAIEDISDFVAEQRGKHQGLITPQERVYRPADPSIAEHLRLDAAP